MSKLFIEDTTLTAIGDAIREKTGTTEPIQTLYMPDVIKRITTGGGGSNKLAQVVDRTVTEITAEDLAGATRIGSYLLYYCSSIIRIEIPNSVTSIGSYAFQNCSNLVSVVIDGDTNITHYAFQDCSNLASVVIGGGNTTINGYAFYNCTSMQVLDFSNCTSVPTLSAKSAFSGVPKTCKFILPDALYDEWINATNWSALTVTYVKKSEYVEGADV